MKWLKHRRGLARLRRLLHTRSVTILLFHSVGRPTVADFLPAGLDCEPELFGRILQLLQREFHVVPLAAIGEKSAHPGRVVLTFDDGFQDNFTVALPHLRQFGFPATVFVAADVIGAAELLPIHRYYWARHHGGKFAESVDSPARRAAVAEFPLAPVLGRELYLQPDEVRALAAAGVEIGAHTCSHPWLAAWPASDQQREIVESQRRLQILTNQPVMSFAYPYGYRHSFDGNTTAIVREHFQRACLSDEGNGLENSLALPRVNVANLFA